MLGLVAPRPAMSHAAERPVTCAAATAADKSRTANFHRSNLSFKNISLVRIASAPNGQFENGIASRLTECTTRLLTRGADVSQLGLRAGATSVWPFRSRRASCRGQ